MAGVYYPAMTPDPGEPFGEPMDEWDNPVGFNYKDWAKENSPYSECVLFLDGGEICRYCIKLALVRQAAREEVEHQQIGYTAPSNKLPLGGCFEEAPPPSEGCRKSVSWRHIFGETL